MERLSDAGGRRSDEQSRPARSRSPRSRPGRVRRWIVRPLIWALAAAVVLVLAAQVLVDSPRMRGFAGKIVREKLGAKLGREVTLDDISLTIVPLSVEVRGFRIAGPDPDGPAFLEVPWGEVYADLGSLKRGLIHLRQVRVERPRLYIEFYPDGSDNLLRGVVRPPDRGERPEPRFEVRIDRLEVDRAEFALDQDRVELSLDAETIRARLAGRGHLHVGGEVSAQNLVVRLPNARPARVSVWAKGDIQRGRVEVTEGRVTRDGFSASGNGSCEWVPGNRRDTQCRFFARGATEGQLLAELGYFPDLRGAVDFEGGFAWRPQTVGWRSRVEAPRLDLWGRRLTGVTGTLVADRYGCRFELDRASYAGGELTGKIDFDAEADARPMTVDLAFQGLAFDTVAADQAIEAQGFAARIGGSFRYRFPLDDATHGHGGGEIAIVPDEALPGLPVSGAFPLRVERGVVTAEAISVRAQRQSLLTSGWFDVDRGRGRFDFELATAAAGEIGQLLPLAEEYRIKTPPWLVTAGRGLLTGSMHLRPEGTVTEVHAELDEPRTPVLAVDRAVADLVVVTDAVEQLDVALELGSRRLELGGRVPYASDDEDGIVLSFDAVDWPLSTSKPWMIDLELPVDGGISGHLDLRFRHEVTDGRLRAVVAPATIELDGAMGDAITVESLATELAWDPSSVRFDRLSAQSEAGLVELIGDVDRLGGEVSLEVASEALRLDAEPFAAYLPRPDLRGEIAVEATIDGPWRQPRLELVLDLPWLALGRRQLDRVEGGRGSRLELRWDEGRLAANGHLLDRVTLAGGGELGSDAADLRLDIASDDLRGILELFTDVLPEELHGSFDGELRLLAQAGSVPAERHVELVLDRLEVGLGERRLANHAPVTLAWHGEALEIAELRLAEEATDTLVTLAGDVGLEADAPLDLRLETRLAASWVDLVAPDLEAAGFLDLDGRVLGTLAAPRFLGTGQVREGRLRLAAGLPYLEEVEGVLRFRPDSVVVEQLDGVLGGGSLTLTGRVELPRDGAPLGYQLQLAGDGLGLDTAAGWSLRGAAELTLRSLADGRLISGRVELDRVAYRQDVRLDVAEILRAVLRRRRLEVSPADSELAATDLNVLVAAPEALRVRNNLARLDGSAELVLRGTLAAPQLYGEVDIDPGGELVYNSTEYDVERARLVFANPYDIDPEIELVATTRVREFDVTLLLSGPLDRLDTRFSSEPPLPDVEVLRLLAGGEAEADPDARGPTTRVDQLTDVNQDPRSASAATFLYGQAAAVIGDRVSDLFGFDKFRIDPLTGSGDNLSKARVTVGKRLSKDLFVTYSTDPASTEDQRLRVEWQVSPALILVLTQNGDDSYSADARWEASF